MHVVFSDKEDFLNMTGFKPSFKTYCFVNYNFTRWKISGSVDKRASVDTITFRSNLI